MATKTQHNRNQEATIWIGGLEPLATEELVWEMCVQAGPVVDVTMPRDKITNTHQGYAFTEFGTPEDADYAIRILNGVKLFGKCLRINKAAQDKSTQQGEQEFYANIFVGGLDDSVDEKLLYDTFSLFGLVMAAKVMTDEEGKPRGFGFINFDTFEAADAAIDAMHNQYICNKQIHVTYAFKKDGTKGERHGTPAERALAKARQVHKTITPQTNALFAPAPSTVRSLQQTAPRPAMPLLAAGMPGGMGMGFMGMGMGMPGAASSASSTSSNGTPASPYAQGPGFGMQMPRPPMPPNPFMGQMPPPPPFMMGRGMPPMPPRFPPAPPQFPGMGMNMMGMMGMGMTGMPGMPPMPPMPQMAGMGRGLPVPPPPPPPPSASTSTATSAPPQPPPPPPAPSSSSAAPGGDGDPKNAVHPARLAMMGRGGPLPLPPGLSVQ